MFLNHKQTWLALGIIALVGIFLASPISAQTVAEGGITFDVDNLSPTGVDIGKEGFWFPNFGRKVAVSGEAVDSNDVNQLPSWVVPDFDSSSSDYSFGDLVSSSADPSWDILRLPDSSLGNAGSLVDPETDSSNNTVEEIRLGPGVPSTFILHVIVDNTFGAHNPANRIRGRAESADGTFDDDFGYNTTPADFNGTSDVYSFVYSGWQENDFIKIQLDSGVVGVDPGFAGLLFDVPEPTGLGLTILGLMATAWTRRRRAAKNEIESNRYLHTYTPAA